MEFHCILHTIFNTVHIDMHIYIYINKPMVDIM